MPRFSANLSMLFTEHDFIERFQAARQAGFSAVEFWFPYDHAKQDLAEAKAGLKIVAFNTHPGDAAAGEWGLAALPDRMSAFRDNFEAALDYAIELDVPNIHVLASNIASEHRNRARDIFTENLAYAADRAARHNLTILIEPLNAFDRPNYLVNDVETAVSVLRDAGRVNARMLFDVFHVQVTSGNILATLRKHLELIGHIQIASVPGRAEPDSGELNLAAILSEIDLLQWKGWVGCEYRPRNGTVQGLSWLKACGWPEAS